MTTSTQIRGYNDKQKIKREQKQGNNMNETLLFYEKYKVKKRRPSEHNTKNYINEITYAIFNILCTIE